MTPAGAPARPSDGRSGDPVDAGRPRTGSVTAFDMARGLGEVTDIDGRVFPFHCTAITDGTRSIAVGTPVVYLVGPGHLGRLEARSVGPVGRAPVSRSTP